MIMKRQQFESTKGRPMNASRITATGPGCHDDASPSPPGEHVTATFCFVDIAGYTALTDTHGEHAAADLVDTFTRVVRTAVVPHGRVHELTGDNAFLVFPDPRRAIDAIAQLYRAVADLPDFPALRTGLHHGSALVRSSRYFGSTINLAARTAAQAAGGEILCTASVAGWLANDPDPAFTLAPVGKVKLKNLPRNVELHSVLLADVPHQRVVDPVCQMMVDTASAAAHRLFEGRHFWFCSTGCAARFAAAPADFL